MHKAFRRTIASAALLLLLAGISFADPQFPQPQGMLNDFAGKLSPGSKQQIEALLQSFKARTGIEIAVVTVAFDDMQGYPIEQYTLELGRQWGVGRDSEKRALLLVVAIQAPDSQGVYHGGTRLEVSRHLEGDVPDILAGELIRKMRNDFMAGRFDQALTTWHSDNSGDACRSGSAYRLTALIRVRLRDNLYAHSNLLAAQDAVAGFRSSQSSSSAL